MLLDMKTVSAVDITMTTVLGLVLLHTWLRERDARLVGWWALIMFVQAGGLVVVSAGALANAPDLITAGLAVMLLSDNVKWTASRDFADRPTPAVWALAGPLVFLLTAFSGMLDELRDRFVLFSMLTAFVNLGAAFELARAKGERLISYWPAVVLLCGTAIAVLLIVPLALSGKVPFHVPSEAYGEGWFSNISVGMVVMRIALAFVVLAMEKQQQEMKQRLIATTDSLTGLPNRRAFYERIEKLERERLAGDAQISVLFFDLDRFKEINDTFGHEIGDCVLTSFADTARDKLKAGDSVVRIGGEEFAALLVGVGPASAVALAEDIRRAFAVEAERCKGLPVGATVSVGVASSTRSGEGAGDISALLRQADAALYAAKRAGRNRVELMASEGDESVKPKGAKSVRKSKTRLAATRSGIR
jgi:diguanylate cyclase (GGDEF)-like protein